MPIHVLCQFEKCAVDLQADGIFHIVVLKQVIQFLCGKAAVAPA